MGLNELQVGGQRTQEQFLPLIVRDLSGRALQVGQAGNPGLNLRQPGGLGLCLGQVVGIWACS